MQSQIVANFLEQYARLKNISEGNPENLYQLTKNNESLLRLCSSIYQIAVEIRKHEISHKEIFSSPTNPNFIKAWREWGYKFEKVVLELVFQDNRSEEFIDISFGVLDQYGISRWDTANLSGWQMVLSLNEFFSLSVQSIDSPKHRGGSLPSDEHDKVEVTIAAFEAWNTLTESIGVNPHVNARRRLLMPFFLVPREVSNKISLSYKSNLLIILDDAQKAFIFGANNAAIALLRSVMEGILRDYYGAEGQRVDELIYSVSEKLPSNINAIKLNYLRKFANAILHNADRGVDPWAGKSEKEIEEHIVSMFEMIRSLIEGVR
jgi:hypothetical protein